VKHFSYKNYFYNNIILKIKPRLKEFYKPQILYFFKQRIFIKNSVRDIFAKRIFIYKTCFGKILKNRMVQVRIILIKKAYKL